MEKRLLVEWLIGLIQNDNLVVFYVSSIWKKTKKEVLIEQHYECQECLKKGILTRADTVHHINYVRNRPDLALSKTYIDSNGIERMNLEAICFECHNRVHNRFTKKEPLTEEWW